MEKFKIMVAGKEETFSFEKLDNQFKFTRILKEGEKLFPGFGKTMRNLKEEQDLSKKLSIIEFLGDEVLKLCTSHDFKTRDKIEDFFGNDYNSFLALVMQAMGFMVSNFQK